MIEAKALLGSVFGFPDFRPGQEEIVSAVEARPRRPRDHADRRRQVAVLPASRPDPAGRDPRHLAAHRPDARPGPRPARRRRRRRGAHLAVGGPRDRGGLPGDRRRAAQAPLHGARAPRRGGDRPPPPAHEPRPPRRRRGPLRQPVGPRLPPRLPAHRRAPPHGGRRPDRGADRHRRRRDPGRDRDAALRRRRARDLPPRLRPAEPVARLRAEGQSAPAGPRLRRRAPRAVGHRLLRQPGADREPRRGARRGRPHRACLPRRPRRRRPPPRRDPLPARGRPRRLRDHRLRHGGRQARHPLRRPRRPAEVDRGLLPGDRARGPRRGAGGHA